MSKVLSSFSYTVNVRVTDEDVANIMSSAMYGCAYWCDTAIPAEDGRHWKKPDGFEFFDRGFETHLQAGGRIKFHDNEDDVWHEIGMDDFIRGIRLWLEKGNDTNGALQSNGEIDCGNIDGCDADLIIQYAIFGEVIYG